MKNCQMKSNEPYNTFDSTDTLLCIYFITFDREEIKKV